MRLRLQCAVILFQGIEMTLDKVQTFQGRVIVEGTVAGKALVCREALSFLGDVDIRTGDIVGDLPSVAGKNVRGTILVMPSTRGSAGAWRFVYQLFKHGTHPAAIICQRLPDPSVVQGAILAKIPIVCELEEEFLTIICTGQYVEVDGLNVRVHATE